MMPINHRITMSHPQRFLLCLMFLLKHLTPRKIVIQHVISAHHPCQRLSAPQHAPAPRGARARRRVPRSAQLSTMPKMCGSLHSLPLHAATAAPSSASLHLWRTCIRIEHRMCSVPQLSHGSSKSASHCVCVCVAVGVP